MARVRNTARAQKRTRHLYDGETMGEVYDPPGITFAEQDGTVARVKHAVVDDVVAKFEFLERVDDDEDSTESTDGSDEDDSDAADDDSAEDTASDATEEEA